MATEADVGEQTLDALMDLIKNANSRDTWEAQNILLRRLALQGDVIASRVPAPRNISEIGGYLNLLATLNQQEMRAQALAGILGVAGPNPPLGWFANDQALRIISLPNDRPTGPVQPSIPLTFAVQSDFGQALQAALDNLHSQGCQLPLLSPVRPLPTLVNGTAPPADALSYLGRVLQIVPAAALHDPTTDPIALARLQGTGAPFEVVSRSTSPAGGSPPVPPQNWDVIQCTNTTCASVTVNDSFLPIAPIMATAGFYPTSPLPQPTTVNSVEWASLANITGLVIGVTRLWDELGLLYRSADVQASAFATQLGWVWDGNHFVSP